MLHDSIMTGKYISEAYNNTVMECTNQNIVQALQHIQGRTKSAKLFFEAMHHRGWYNVEASHPSQAAKQMVDQQLSGQMTVRLEDLERSMKNQE